MDGSLICINCNINRGSRSEGFYETQYKSQLWLSYKSTRVYSRDDGRASTSGFEESIVRSGWWSTIANDWAYSNE